MIDKYVCMMHEFIGAILHLPYQYIYDTPTVEQFRPALRHFDICAAWYKERERTYHQGVFFL